MNKLLYKYFQDNNNIHEFNIIKDVSVIDILKNTAIDKVNLNHVSKYKYDKIICTCANVDLNIYIPIDTIDEDLDELLYNICNITVKLRYLSRSEKFIDTHIFLIDNPKLIPESSNIILGQSHINSAYTLFTKTSNDIYMWRKEEVQKVFIHELLHALDFCSAIVPQRSYDFHRYFSLHSNNLYFGEAYVEFYATLINILLIADNYSMVESMIKREQKHSIYQAAKILRYYTIYNFNDIYIKKDKLFKEDTNVFMYYIIKSIILYKYNTILNICNKYGRNHLLDISPKNDNFTKDLFNEVFAILDTTKYISHINKLLNDATNQDTSLRMTVFG